MSMLRVLLLFLFLLFLVAYGGNNCRTSFCRYSSIPIRFPFRLSGQPETCGYPGFDISCGFAGKPVLNLPHSGSFLISSINYIDQEIQLYDPYGCIQSRVLKLNLSSSPFKAAYYVNFTFLTCTYAASFYINCLSSPSNYTIAIRSDHYQSYLFYGCKAIIDSQQVAVSRLYQYPWLSYPTLLDDELLLKWEAPNCRHCEATGRICGLEDSTIGEIKCFRDPADARARTAAIIAGITVPIIICSIFILCYKYIRQARQQNIQVNATAQSSVATTATGGVPHVALGGLDDSTIESYAKVVLGESRRIPGPNSTTCPICLSDYLPKDTLRCIPECEHCFHADCIDEWLRLNSMCPVCRNSPSSVVN